MDPFAKSGSSAAPGLKHALGSFPIAPISGGRIPPNAVPLEASILGMLLVDPSLAHDLQDVLRVEHFYEPRHVTIYQAIGKVLADGRTPDLTNVHQKLIEMDELENVGGAQYLAGFTMEIATPRLLLEHVKVVIQKYLQRELIKAASEIVDNSYNAQADVEDLLESAEQKIFKIHQDSLLQDVEDAHDVVKQALEIVANAQENKSGVSGVHTGFPLLDSVTGGWAPGNLIIVAARPSMGKTAFAMNMARNMAVEHGLSVAIFSLEMPSSHLMLRLLISESELDGKMVRAGKLSASQWEIFNQAAINLSDLPLFFDETQALGVGEFRSKCRRLKQQHKIDVIMVDYLQLMSAPVDFKANREQEVSQISKTLKAVAKELKVPVIALAQLSRAGNLRPGNQQRPILSDLRESGAIEQDADVVAFIHRPERIGVLEYPDHTPTNGIAEFIIAKNRDGETGVFYLKFEPQFTRFSDSLPQVDHMNVNNAGMVQDLGQQVQQFSSKMNDDQNYPDLPVLELLPDPGMDFFDS